MVRVVIVDVPLHITSMWLPRYTDDPATTGSLGAGVVIRPGVKLTVKLGGKREPSVGLINQVLARFNVDAVVSYKSPVELGVGYGMSAALALGAAVGVAALLGRSMIEAAKVAHVVEVENRTGLGDVIAEYYGGGIEVRVRPGPPGVGLIDRVPYPEDLVVLTVDLGRGSTPTMLRELANKLNEIGPRYIEKIINEPTYENFVGLSREFSREIGFLTRDIEGRLSPCARYADTYYVKKGVLVILTHEDEEEQLTQCLGEVGIAARRFMISNEGLKIVLEDR
ncbi:MAG: pantothenate kinase [Vulcanisaeta sp.]|nr:pantothenate kinase [Vulcanisaeta sp.]